MAEEGIDITAEKARILTTDAVEASDVFGVLPWSESPQERFESNTLPLQDHRAMTKRMPGAVRMSMP